MKVHVQEVQSGRDIAVLVDLDAIPRQGDVVFFHDEAYDVTRVLWELSEHPPYVFLRVTRQ